MTEITKEIAPGATPYTSAKTFEELNLSPELLKARAERRMRVRCARAPFAAGRGACAKTLTLGAAAAAALLCAAR